MSALLDILRYQTYPWVWVLDATTGEPLFSSRPYRLQAPLPEEVVEYNPRLDRASFTHEIFRGIEGAGGADLTAEILIENLDESVDLAGIEGTQVLLRLGATEDSGLDDSDFERVLQARVVKVERAEKGKKLQVSLGGTEGLLRERAFAHERLLGLGRAVDLSGPGVASIPYDARLDPTDGFFFFLWLRPFDDPKAYEYRIVFQQDPPFYGAEVRRLAFRDGFLEVHMRDETSVSHTLKTELSIEPLVWQAIGIGWDGTTLRAFKDGVASAGYEAVASMQATTKDLVFSSGSVPGLAGRCVYFNRALTTGEAAKAMDPHVDFAWLREHATVVCLLESEQDTWYDETENRLDVSLSVPLTWTDSETGPLGATGSQPIVLGTERVTPTPLSWDGKVQGLATGPVHGVGAVYAGDYRLWLKAERRGVMTVTDGSSSLAEPTRKPDIVCEGEVDLSVFSPGQSVEIQIWTDVPVVGTVLSATANRLVLETGVGVASTVDAFVTLKTTAPAPASLILTFDSAAGTITGASDDFRNRRGGQKFAIAGTPSSDGTYTIGPPPVRPFDTLVVAEGLPASETSLATITWEEAYEATADLGAARLYLEGSPGEIELSVEVHGAPGPVQVGGYETSLALYPDYQALPSQALSGPLKANPIPANVAYGEVAANSAHDRTGSLVLGGIVSLLEAPSADFEVYSKGANYKLVVTPEGALAFEAAGTRVSSAAGLVPTDGTPVQVGARVGSGTWDLRLGPVGGQLSVIASGSWGGSIAPDATAPLRIGMASTAPASDVWVFVLGDETLDLSLLLEPQVSPFANPAVAEYFLMQDRALDGTVRSIRSTVTGLDLTFSARAYLHWIGGPWVGDLAHTLVTAASLGGASWPADFALEDLAALRDRDGSAVGRLVEDSETVGEALDNFFQGTGHVWLARLDDQLLSAYTLEPPTGPADVVLSEIVSKEPLPVTAAFSGVRATYRQRNAAGEWDAVEVGDMKGKVLVLTTSYVKEEEARTAAQRILGARTAPRKPWRVEVPLETVWSPSLPRDVIELDGLLYRATLIGVDKTQGLLSVELWGGEEP